nr:hypothetical protein [Rhodococcus sp. (in: high G+C Gram-positive bacteria)]
MRIRTLHGPPLPTEIVVHTALALALSAGDRPAYAPVPENHTRTITRPT